MYDSVFPLVKQKYSDKIQIIFRQTIQPWHPSSTLVHEAGVAVLQTQPDKFWEFSKALFDKQTEYFDTEVVNETRNNTYKRLAKIAGSVGLDEKTIYSKLEISDKPGPDGSKNSGNGVTNDLKPLVKVCRIVVSSGLTMVDRSTAPTTARCPRNSHSLVQCEFLLASFRLSGFANIGDRVWSRTASPAASPRATGSSGSKRMLSDATLFRHRMGPDSSCVGQRRSHENPSLSHVN